MSKLHPGDSLDKSVSCVDSHSDSDSDSDVDNDSDGGGGDHHHTASDSDSDREVSMIADHGYSLRHFCQHSTELLFVMNNRKIIVFPSTSVYVSNELHGTTLVWLSYFPRILTKQKGRLRKLLISHANLFQRGHEGSYPSERKEPCLTMHH